MPATHPSSRQDNLRQSIDEYIRVNIEVGLGRLVQYQRQPRRASLPTIWATVYAQALSALTLVKRTGSQRFGSQSQYLIDINVFQRQEAIRQGNETLYTLDTAMADILDYFAVGSRIDIFDFQTVGDPLVGVLKIVEEPVVIDLSESTPQDAGINQLNLRVTANYLSESTV